MSVTTTTTRIQYSGDDITTAFTFSFRVYTAGDLTVYTTISGVDTLQVLDTDYTATVNATTAAPGGTLTFTTAPVTGDTITIYRDLDATQGTAYTVGGPFPASAHETALDRLTLLVQDLTERVNRRAPDYGVTSSGTSPY